MRALMIGMHEKAQTTKINSVPILCLEEMDKFRAVAAALLVVAVLVQNSQQIESSPQKYDELNNFKSERIPRSQLQLRTRPEGNFNAQELAQNEGFTPKSDSNLNIQYADPGQSHLQRRNFQDDVGVVGDRRRESQIFPLQYPVNSNPVGHAHQSANFVNANPNYHPNSIFPAVPPPPLPVPMEQLSSKFQFPPGVKDPRAQDFNGNFKENSQKRKPFRMRVRARRIFPTAAPEPRSFAQAHGQTPAQANEPLPSNPGTTLALRNPRNLQFNGPNNFANPNFPPQQNYPPQQNFPPQNSRLPQNFQPQAAPFTFPRNNQTALYAGGVTPPPQDFRHSNQQQVPPTGAPFAQSVTPVLRFHYDNPPPLHPQHRPNFQQTETGAPTPSIIRFNDPEPLNHDLATPRSLQNGNGNKLETATESVFQRRPLSDERPLTFQQQLVNVQQSPRPPPTSSSIFPQAHMTNFGPQRPLTFPQQLLVQGTAVPFQQYQYQPQQYQYQAQQQQQQLVPNYAPAQTQQGPGHQQQFIQQENPAQKRIAPSNMPFYSTIVSNTPPRVFNGNFYQSASPQGYRESPPQYQMPRPPNSIQQYQAGFSPATAQYFNPPFYPSAQYSGLDNNNFIPHAQPLKSPKATPVKATPSTRPKPTPYKLEIEIPAFIPANLDGYVLSKTGANYTMPDLRDEVIQHPTEYKESMISHQYRIKPGSTEYEHMGSSPVQPLPRTRSARERPLSSAVGLEDGGNFKSKRMTRKRVENGGETSETFTMLNRIFGFDTTTTVGTTTTTAPPVDIRHIFFTTPRLPLAKRSNANGGKFNTDKSALSPIQQMLESNYIEGGASDQRTSPPPENILDYTEMPPLDDAHAQEEEPLETPPKRKKDKKPKTGKDESPKKKDKKAKPEKARENQSTAETVTEAGIEIQIESEAPPSTTSTTTTTEAVPAPCNKTSAQVVTSPSVPSSVGGVPEVQLRILWPAQEQAAGATTRPFKTITPQAVLHNFEHWPQTGNTMRPPDGLVGNKFPHNELAHAQRHEVPFHSESQKNPQESTAAVVKVFRQLATQRPKLLPVTSVAVETTTELPGNEGFAKSAGRFAGGVVKTVSSITKLLG